MKDSLIYLDNNATTACAPEAWTAMSLYMAGTYGNASSLHYAGRVAHKAVEEAREKLAALLSVQKHELFFNSGATEGNNWIFLSILKSQPEKKRIVISSIEHKAVLLSAGDLANFGYEIVELPVTADGVLDLAAAAAQITPATLLVSVQYANNETGVIQPIAELVEMAHRQGALFHCDAVQGLGKSILDLSSLAVDSACFSAHKIHGPKGVGALFLRHGARSWPLKYPFQGGGQEHEIRPGTLNVAGIVGFGAAAELLHKHLPERLSYMTQLQQFLEEQLESNIPGCIIHGKNAPRIPNTTYVSVPNIPADMLLANLPLFAISEGSACNNGAIGMSYVLKAMSVSPDIAETSIRISTSFLNTRAELRGFMQSLCSVISHFAREEKDDSRS